MSGWRTRAAAVGAAALLTLAAGACSSPQQAGPPAPVPTGTATPTATPEPPAQPSGAPAVVASGFTSPWSVVRLSSGSALVSERDTGLVKEVTPDGTVRTVGEVDGVSPGGEGGLLGLAVTPDTEEWLYAYFTGADDNRIVRFALEGGPGGFALGTREDVLSGIAKAGNHNGGRIAFGPDGMLYATTGDAGQRDAAQNGSSLSGKILRMTETGAEPDDNPFPGSLIYSLGHRNPQGIAWDDSGQLWAAEFGQNTWDELNAITPGANYGWPLVEGAASDPAFTNPVTQWSTAEASPSGLAYTRGTLFLAALRGQRVWSITTTAGVAAVPWFVGAYGRVRDVTAGPDGTLWMLTSNTDGRGDARDGDDRLLQVPLAPPPPG